MGNGEASTRFGTVSVSGNMMWLVDKSRVSNNGEDELEHPE
jgi:hypothetical protein